MQHDSPITSVKLFTLLTEIDCPSFVSQGMSIHPVSFQPCARHQFKQSNSLPVLETEDDGIEAEGEIHLLVSSATEPTVVYRSVFAA